MGPAMLKVLFQYKEWSVVSQISKINGFELG